MWGKRNYPIPPHLEMGRGTARSVVEGKRHDLRNFPSTSLRLVPLPTLRVGRNDVRKCPSPTSRICPRGKWADLEFLRNVYDLNDKAKDTQFADYHGHGWNFRGVFKRDREGNLLDADGKIVSPDDPEKWRRKGEGKFVPVGTNPGKSVHLMDIHAEKGLQCADCHFAQDSQDRKSTRLNSSH